MAWNTVPLHGKAAAIRKNGANVGFSSDWSISAKVDKADSSSLGDSWKSYLAGMADWSGSMKCHFVMGDAAQKAIHDSLISATPGTILTDVFFLVDRTTVANQYSGNIIIDQVQVQAAIGGIVTLSMNFQGTGALSLINTGV